VPHRASTCRGSSSMGFALLMIASLRCFFSILEKTENFKQTTTMTTST
jgi:hypothetical protein